MLPPGKNNALRTDAVCDPDEDNPRPAPDRHNENLNGCSLRHSPPTVKFGRDPFIIW